MRKDRVLFRTQDPVEHTQISIEVRDPPASESVIDYDSDYDSTASVPIENFLTDGWEQFGNNNRRKPR
jgi:hypothetical protein